MSDLTTLAQSRLDICNACQFLVERNCILCGCVVDDKVLDPEENCPAPQPKWVAQSRQSSKPVDPRVGCIPCRSKGNKK